MLRTFALRIAIAAAIALPGLFAGAVAPAQAFGLHAFKSCDSPAVLRTITHRFGIADRNVLHMGIAIEDYFNIHQNRYTPRTDTEFIERRYCHGQVAMSDGHTRTIWYLIESGQGFAGIGDNVEFCISGLDSWHIYGANCRSVR
ncbi:hypothetical protein [Hoeflea poritis]|uniref:Uncharacterized protein n=1 Tax=Hoeflea poritis TaxID=2993659 RepID=A0ABT4VQM4_9HYPH|nr:hypothetical protein [Hoeflea poritis]MDA4846989.1 hypothetical protein [Hoeflea poritis]